MLKVEALNSGYEKLHVLYDVSVDCGKEEIIAVLRPNGAGKTTLLNSIFGIADVYSGSVKVDEEDITKLPAHVIARKGVAYVLQMINIFSELSVGENLRMSAAYARISDVNKKLREIYEIFPILSERRRQRAGTLSGGERQMLAISIGLIRDPKILLLDEPTVGLMPLYVDLIIKKVNETRKERGFYWTFLPWLMVLLGGIGSNRGALLGTAIFVALDKLIIYCKHSLEAVIPFDVVWLDYILLGIITAVILIYRPQGLLPERSHIPKDLRERIRQKLQQKT